ncbi:MAG: pantoate--beta-alanine ligase [bacterium]|nr:pantoate--beta-alanine ligase [bacterium]
MKIIRNISSMQKYSLKCRDKKKIGFVPTMGYLHEGHLSLIKRARKENDIVVLSIFVNPIQFGPKEDFEKYPRDFKRDERMSKSAGADIIFYPSWKDMYPEGYKTYLEVKDLQDHLCGRSRPGHFKGVATVVAKLFNIVQPFNAYFGQKDAQQCIIIKQMTRDLNIPVNIKVLETFRESDGLAMSSRNSYLLPKERKAALVVSRTLLAIKKNILSGERNINLLSVKANKLIKKEPLARLDYFSFADENTLEKITKLSGNVLVSAAVWIGKTRLIDNFRIGIK